MRKIGFITYKLRILPYFTFALVTAASIILTLFMGPGYSDAVQCGGGFPADIPGGVAGLQQQIDTAASGQTINIPAGTVWGSTAVPLGVSDLQASEGRGGSDTCMLRIENKKLILKGAGTGSTFIYGEGHAQPNVMPYQTRAGICIINSDVTIENLTIQEFQKRCAVVYNSKVTVNNSIIAGCDEGGFSMLGNSTGLFVNNIFAEMNFGGVMLWENAVANIVNNDFYNAAVLYFYHNTTDQTHATITNNIFSSIKSDIAQVSWWPVTSAQMQMSTLANDVIYRSPDFVCDPNFEFWCANFPGKIVADPLYSQPVTDPCGIAVWADFSLQSGSPAIGSGDISIPGPRNLGTAGGPCLNQTSSICSSFIASNMPAVVVVDTPTPTPNPLPSPTPTLLPGQPTLTPTPNIFVNGNTGGYARSPLDDLLLFGDKTASEQEFGMKWLIYVAASFLYIMVIHFAMGIRKEFKVWIMVAIFAFGGFFGWYLGSLEAGYIFSVIFLFLFY